MAQLLYENFFEVNTCCVDILLGSRKLIPLICVWKNLTHIHMIKKIFNGLNHIKSNPEDDIPLKWKSRVCTGCVFWFPINSSLKILKAESASRRWHWISFETWGPTEVLFQRVWIFVPRLQNKILKTGYVKQQKMKIKVILLKNNYLVKRNSVNDWRTNAILIDVAENQHFYLSFCIHSPNTEGSYHLLLAEHWQESLKKHLASQLFVSKEYGV